MAVPRVSLNDSTKEQLQRNAAPLFSSSQLFPRRRHYVSCMPVDTSVTGTLQEGPASRAMALALSAFKGKCLLPRSREKLV